MKNRKINLYIHKGFISIRGLQRDVVYLCRPIAPLVYEPKSGGRGGEGCGVSANEYRCAHHVTLRPNKLGDLTPYLTYDFHGCGADDIQ